MSKIETTSKVSRKLTSRINLWRQGARAKLPTLETAHKHPPPPPTAWKGSTPNPPIQPNKAQPHLPQATPETNAHPHSTEQQIAIPPWKTLKDRKKLMVLSLCKAAGYNPTRKGSQNSSLLEHLLTNNAFSFKLFEILPAFSKQLQHSFDCT